MAEATMSDVVSRLHGEGSEVLLELLEFDYALDEILRNLERLAIASQELHVEMRRLVTDDQSFSHIGAAEEQAGRLSAKTMQIVAAFRMLRDAVKTWNIAATRRPSSKPGAAGGSFPD